MNTLGYFILCFLIVEFLINLISDIFNLRQLKTSAPEELSDVYDEKEYARSQQYIRDNTRFDILTSLFGLIVTISFWLLGGFGYLDEIVRTHFDSEIVRGLVYIGILSFAQMIIGLPFSAYNTFVIEEKYGFNRTTVKTFLFDILKSIIISALIGGLLLAGLLYVFEVAGNYSWLIGWIAIVLFVLLVQYIAPVWIMPLFNKFEPLEDEELKDKILDFAKKVNFPLRNVFKMDGSKRSSKANAFFTGFGKNKRIALFDTLLEKHSHEEILVILAHEIGHYKLKHIIKGMAVSIVQFGVLLFLLQVILYHPEFSEMLFDAFFVDHHSVYAGLLFFGMLYSPVQMILSIIMNHISRKHEFQADSFAAQHTEMPEKLIDALKQLSKNNLSNLTPHKMNVVLNYSHPPLLERIKNLHSFRV